MGGVRKEMKKPKRDWKELYDGSYHALYEDAHNKKGENDYILSYRGMYVYFTPKEFSELIDGFKEAANQLFKPKGDCYK